MQLRQVTHVNEMAEAFQGRSENILYGYIYIYIYFFFFLDKQHVINYRSECDIIRNSVEHIVIP